MICKMKLGNILKSHYLYTKQSNCYLRSLFEYRSYSKDNKSKVSPLKSLLDDAASYEDLIPKRPEQQWTTSPYLQSCNKRTQGDFHRREKHDPRETSIILFPGQGSQYVGMAKNLIKFPLVQDLFELSNYILKYDLLKFCLEGPKGQLDQTKYAQPAIMVTSLASIEQLKEERPKAVDNCVATSGFSLGEITALVFAGALQFEKALKLVQIRAEAMQLACETYKGGMATVLIEPNSKLNYALLKAREWALDRGDELPECKIANYLHPGCKVVSGSESALDFLQKNYKDFNLKRVTRLPVSGAFHTDLMKPAVEPFRRALKKMEISEPVVSVYSNVDAKRYTSVDQIRRQLPKQIVKPVKWEQILHVIYSRGPEDYFPRTFECGPGNSLKAILKQVNAKAWNECYSVETKIG